MAERERWTAADLEKLPPAERNTIVRTGIVADLTEVPERFLEQVRANVRDHIATNEAATTPER